MARIASVLWQQRFRRNSSEIPLQGFPGTHRYQFSRAFNSSLQIRIKPFERFYLLKGKQLVSTWRDVSEDKQTLVTRVCDSIQIAGAPKLGRGRSQRNSCAARLALFSHCAGDLRAAGGQNNAKLPTSALADVHLAGHSIAIAQTFRFYPEPLRQWFNRKTPLSGR